MTMTLEELRRWVGSKEYRAHTLEELRRWVGSKEYRVQDGIDAAIRERDALRFRLEALIDELAAMRKRIEDAPTGLAVSEWKGLKCNLVVHGLPGKWHGRTVRLLVDDAPD